jgi:hypothetical protein
MSGKSVSKTSRRWVVEREGQSKSPPGSSGCSKPFGPETYQVRIYLLDIVVENFGLAHDDLELWIRYEEKNKVVSSNKRAMKRDEMDDW